MTMINVSCTKIIIVFIRDVLVYITRFSDRIKYILCKMVCRNRDESFLNRAIERSEGFESDASMRTIFLAWLHVSLLSRAM